MSAIISEYANMDVFGLHLYCDEIATCYENFPCFLAYYSAENLFHLLKCVGLAFQY